MADNTQQFTKQAQDIAQSFYGNLQGMVEMQVSVAQQLSGVQQEILQQSTERTSDEMQLISRLRDPREYATAKAELIKRYGDRYVETINKSIDITVAGWKEYADRLESSADTAASKTRTAAKKST